MLWSAIFGFLLGISSLASGLKCYICGTIVGAPDPTNCNTNPTEDTLTLITDEGLEPLPRSTFHSSADLFLNSLNVDFPKAQWTLATGASKAGNETWPYKWCVKLTSTTNGVSIIQRTAFGFKEENVVKAGCQTLPEEPGSQNGKACFCNTDGCNKANSDSEYTSQGGGGGGNGKAAILGFSRVTILFTVLTYVLLNS